MTNLTLSTLYPAAVLVGTLVLAIVGSWIAGIILTIYMAKETKSTQIKS